MVGGLCNVLTVRGSSLNLRNVDEGIQECFQKPCAGSITCSGAHTTQGMSNIFLYIAVYIMYFLAMALHRQYNKHIILSGKDNRTFIQVSSGFFITVAAAAGFDLKM